ncbi:glycosyltransferase family 2 protein [Treponema zioleckii]|uniref:glycosyltransferase family 2 protein n=1 Tax=Treponema zioleckii TaxID=331680 RepID=UPI00168BBB7E|nr:glycosyltransferase family 2 protein [Treponema zioleckii]
MTKPLLSICIPTYNRAEYLEKSLESLVSQPEFAQIEVVISDNASTDNTEEVCRSYQKKYPNIVYFRNEENIHDRNFPTALMRANGIYRKLYNDNMLHLSGSLRFLLELIDTYKDSKPLMFFLHGKFGAKKINNPEKFEVKGVDELVLYTSHHFTWLAGFGFWEDECTNLEKEFDWCEKKIWQSYKGLKSASARSKSVIVTKKLIEWIPVAKRDYTYGLYTVFFQNFPNLLSEYKVIGKISKKTVSRVRKHMLFTLAGGWIGNVKHNLNAEVGNQKNFMNLIFHDYRKEIYYPFFRIDFFVRNAKKKFVIKAKELLCNNSFGKKLLAFKRKYNLKFY